MKNSLFCIALMSAIILLFTQNTSYTYSSGNFAARTNAPGESSCAASSCHGTNSDVLNGAGSAEITITDDPVSYELNKTYTITVQTTDPNAVRYGMQMTVLEGNAPTDASPSVGSWVAPAGMQIKSQDNRSYIVHTSTENNTGTWTFEWMAPETNEGDITFYLAALAANGNGNKAGDFVYFNTLTLNAPEVSIVCPEFSNPIIPITPLCPSDEFDLSIDLTGELPEGASDYYYYYSDDPSFDPYSGAGTYLGASGDDFFAITHESCAPKNFTIKAAFVKFSGSDAVDGPPTDESCRPIFLLGQVTVFSTINAIASYDTTTCEIKIKTNCVQHFVGVDEDSLVQNIFTVPVNAGETIESINYIVKSGDVDCDAQEQFTSNINATCGEIMNGLQGLENMDVKAFFNDQSNLQINIESPESSVMKAVLMDVNGREIKEQKLEISNGFNSFEMDCGSLSKGVYILNVNAGYSVKLFKY